MPETQRLFFALWPADAVRLRIAEIIRRLEPVSRGRPVDVGNLHLTLSFLGYVSPATRICVEQLAASIRGERFVLTLDSLGYWVRPQVLWLGSREVPAALVDLVARLNDGVKACGLQAEERPYQPHLTLLRKVKPAGARAVRGQGNFLSLLLEWPVEGFALVESRLHPKGVRYQVLQTWAFGAPPLSK